MYKIPGPLYIYLEDKKIGEKTSVEGSYVVKYEGTYFLCEITEKSVRRPEEDNEWNIITDVQYVCTLYTEQVRKKLLKEEHYLNFEYRHGMFEKKQGLMRFTNTKSKIESIIFETFLERDSILNKTK